MKILWQEMRFELVLNNDSEKYRCLKLIREEYGNLERFTFDLDNNRITTNMAYSSSNDYQKMVRQFAKFIGMKNCEKWKLPWN